MCLHPTLEVGFGVLYVLFSILHRKCQPPVSPQDKLMGALNHNNNNNSSRFWDGSNLDQQPLELDESIISFLLSKHQISVDTWYGRGMYANTWRVIMRGETPEKQAVLKFRRDKPLTARQCEEIR